MQLTPDQTIYWQWGPVVINATLVNTWIVMVLLAAGAWWITRHLRVRPPLSRRQTALEALVTLTDQQITEVMGRGGARYLPFIGTIFLFILTMNLLSVTPGYASPAGSLSTTAALAAVVFFAIPYYGIRSQGVGSYLRQYLQPSPLMLPFNIIGELSRTLAMAIRLFGNTMSGDMIIAILLLVAPLFFPVIMQILGLLVGVIQAYIFAILAAVFIASAISQDT